MPDPTYITDPIGTGTNARIIPGATAYVPNPNEADGQGVSPAPSSPATVFYSTALPGFSITSDDSPYPIEFPRLVTVSGDLTFDQNAYPLISFGVLTSVNALSITNGASAISFPALASAAAMTFTTLTSTAALNFPSLTTLSDLLTIDTAAFGSVSFAAVTSATSMTLANMTGTGALSFAGLATMSGDLSLSNLVFSSINFDSLVSANSIAISGVSAPISFPALQTNGAMTLTGNTAVAPFNLPSLTTLTGDFSSESDAFSTMTFPALTSAAAFSVVLSTASGTLAFPELDSMSGAFTIQNTTFSAVDLSKATTIDSFVWFTNQIPSLTCPLLTTCSSGMIMSSDDFITSLSFPQLTDAGSILILGVTVLASISMPLAATFASFSASNANVLATVNLDAVVTVSGDFQIAACPLITALSFPVLQTITANANFFTNQAMTSFSAPNWVPTDGTTLDFSGCALTDTSVNHILARAVAAGMTSGTINLFGGTNSAPTGQGILDAATLTTAGVAVTTN